MTTIRQYIFLAVLGILFLSSGCRKEDDFSPTNALSVNWKVSKVEIDGTEDLSTDYRGYTFAFNKNTTYNFSHSPSSKVTTQGNWKLKTDSTSKELQLTGVDGKVSSVLVGKLSKDSAELIFTIPATFKSSEKTAVYFLKRE